MWYVLSSETIVDNLDSDDQTLASRTVAEMKKIKNLSRPYLVSAGIESGIRFVHTMNPLMSSILEKSEFVEADITFNETKEYLYLFNLVAFDDVALE